MSPSWRGFVPERSHDMQLRNLEQQISVYEGELESTFGRQGSAEWHVTARSLLNEARKSADGKGRESPIDRGWWMYLAARRACIAGLSERKVLEEAKALRQEATEKLRGWRRASVLEMLGDPDPKEEGTAALGFSKLDLAGKRIALERATLVRDEHSQNDYRKLGELKSQLTILGWLVAGLVTGIVVFSVFHELPIDRGVGWRDLLYVIAFGALGGTVSSFTPIRDARGRFPEQLALSRVMVVRPLLGAASGLAAYLFLAGGVIDVGRPSEAVLLAVAFAAGFSEKVILRAVSAVAGEKEKAPAPS